MIECLRIRENNNKIINYINLYSNEKIYIFSRFGIDISKLPNR